MLFTQKMAVHVGGGHTKAIFSLSNEGVGHPLGKQGMVVSEWNKGMNKPEGLSCATEKREARSHLWSLLRMARREATSSCDDSPPHQSPSQTYDCSMSLNTQSLSQQGTQLSFISLFLDKF